MERWMSAAVGVSIIVNNYNSAQFLRAAIDSALAQDHPLVEVIVVDDCSTDGSAGIVSSYGNRILALIRPQNGGQVAAINQALPLATKNLVIFLDGDDILMPNAASTVAAAWRPGIAKIQYCLGTINSAGEDQGYVWPEYPANLDAAAIRRQLVEEGSCPSVSACGNAYARDFLQRWGARSELRWIHYMLEVDAPFAGEVCTIPTQLAYYRHHDNSDSQTTSVGAIRFQKMLTSYVAKLDYLDLRCREMGIDFDLASVKAKSLWYSELRLILCKLGEPGTGSLLATLVHALGTLGRASQPAKKKLFVALWQLALAISPKRYVSRILAYRFLPQSRPRLIRGRVSPVQAAASDDQPVLQAAVPPTVLP